MIVRSTVYPDLLVTDLGVRFRDGIAEVDEATGKQLLRLPGIELEAEPGPVRKARRKTNE
ncbi:hypothetical protein [Actinobaculum sp. 352]|uniref:hypothetical protein n=1 Tax=Actinobaculum sp. 352 TaxID=2490946 RepID=UPI000F7EDE0F|nr:hypothetical protein [Actinobaculum sp. 352]RTE48822.1 hypothetical protein EKN07_08955 [Actinobaculum sp. 352]